MKFRNHNQTGVGHLVALLLIVVVAVVCLVGYRVVKNQNQVAGNRQSAADKVANADKITNAADLQKTNASLEQVPVSTDLDPGQLDQDLSDLY